VDFVEDLQAKWARAYDAGDWAALAALYSSTAQLVGAKPQLYEGREEVLFYFEVLEPGGRVAFDAPRGCVLGARGDVAVAAFRVNFMRDGTIRPTRMTWTLECGRDGWLIASHHASAVPG
jgi:hypothetical protein